jgi:hypothetical protein
MQRTRRVPPARHHILLNLPLYTTARMHAHKYLVTDAHRVTHSTEQWCSPAQGQLLLHLPCLLCS